MASPPDRSPRPRPRLARVSPYRTVTIDGVEWQVAEYRERGAVLSLSGQAAEVFETRWLYAHGRGAARRLAVFPEDWQALDSSRLAELLAAARPCRPAS